MSFQIKSIEFLNKKIILSHEINNNDNIYTLIIGKNGLGKTRILNTIILNYLKETYKPSIYYQDPDFEAFITLDNLKIDSKYSPQKIIAHTNSAYNRFPSDREANTKIYERPFMSGGYYNEDNVFYKILFSKKTNFKAVSETLSYLGYMPKITYIFKIRTGSTPKGYLEKTILIYKKPLVKLGFDCEIAPQKLARLNKKFLTILFYFYDLHDKIFSEQEVIEAFKIISTNDIIEKNIEITIDTSNNKLKHDFLKKNDFNLLVRLGFIVINRTYLYNLNAQNDLFNSDEKVLFGSLSSGQKSIISTLIGISTAIEENSLICIDEPEISLHPEWQEEIIYKLQQVFNEIKGCHFIIATHSPQVVSGLNNKNGFIVNLEKLETYSSFNHTHKSADYQLATLFDTPGFQNEYLIRICLTILSKLSKNEKLSDEDKNNIQILNKIKKSIPENDSVFFLIEQTLNVVE